MPETLANISPRFQTPDRAVLLFSGLVGIMVASGAFTFLASVTSLGGQVITLFSIAAFVALMHRRENGPGSHLFMPSRVVHVPAVIELGNFAEEARHLHFLDRAIVSDEPVAEVIAHPL